MLLVARRRQRSKSKERRRQRSSEPFSLTCCRRRLIYRLPISGQHWKRFACVSRSFIACADVWLSLRCRCADYARS